MFCRKSYKNTHNFTDCLIYYFYWMGFAYLFTHMEQIGVCSFFYSLLFFCAFQVAWDCIWTLIRFKHFYVFSKFRRMQQKKNNVARFKCPKRDILRWSFDTHSDTESKTDFFFGLFFWLRCCSAIAVACNFFLFCFRFFFWGSLLLPYLYVYITLAQSTSVISCLISNQNACVAALYVYCVFASFFLRSFCSAVSIFICYNIITAISTCQFSASFTSFFFFGCLINKY